MSILNRDSRTCPACGPDTQLTVVTSQYRLPYSSPFGVQTDWRCSVCSYRSTELNNVIFRSDGKARV